MTVYDQVDSMRTWACTALKEDGGAALAAELFGAYTALRPADDHALLLLGDALRRVGRFADAEQALQRALSVAPEPARLRVTAALASLMADRGFLDQAEEWFRRATADEVGTTDGSLWIMRGANLAVLGRLDEAADCHERAAQLSGDADEAYLNIGYVRRAQRRYEAAMDAFQKALELSPDYREARTALNGLREIFSAMEFLTFVEHIGDGASTSIDDRLDRMREWARAAHDEEAAGAVAAELLAAYTAHRTADQYALFLLGESLREVGRSAEAEEVLLRAVTAAPPKGRARVMASLGMLMADRGFLDQAEEWFRRAAEDESGASNGWIWILRGANLAAAERYDDAAACHERAAHLSGGAHEAYLKLGYVRRAQRRYEEALEAFRKAINHAPDSQDARAALDGLSQIFNAMEFAALLGP